MRTTARPFHPRFGRILAAGLVAATLAAGATGDRVGEPAELSPAMREALADEAAGRTEAALEKFLEAARAAPPSAFLRQRIARQFSDLVEAQPDLASKRRFAAEALRWSRAAVAEAPDDPVARLSVAISLGKVALYGDARTKVENARGIKAEAETALRLDPNYDWAHHVLGRWHVEVAALGRTKRLVAGVLYGGLPAADAAVGLDHLRRAVALAPARVAHRVELGGALVATGRRDAGRAELEAALRLPAREPHDAASHTRARRWLEELDEVAPTKTVGGGARR